MRERTWWRQSTGEYRGAEATLARLADVLVDGRYDGVIGFSMGGALAILLASLSCRPSLVRAFDDELADRPLAPLRFAVLIGAYKATDPLLTPCYEAPIAMPSLHIIGAHDTVCWPGASLFKSSLSLQNGPRALLASSCGPRSSCTREGTTSQGRVGAMRSSTLCAVMIVCSLRSQWFCRCLQCPSPRRLRRSAVRARGGPRSSASSADDAWAGSKALPLQPFRLNSLRETMLRDGTSELVGSRRRTRRSPCPAALAESRDRRSRYRRSARQLFSCYLSLATARCVTAERGPRLELVQIGASIGLACARHDQRGPSVLARRDPPS